LHGNRGQRAATWYDHERAVCWLLGVVGQHAYEVFEARAANHELLPGEDDLAILNQETGEFDALIEPGIRKLVEDAVAAPGVPQRGTVGGLLRLEVTVIAERIGDSDLSDVYISLRIPPLPKGEPAPAGWPGQQLVERLAELAVGDVFAALDCATPTEVPAGPGQWRSLDPASEVSVVVRNIVFGSTE
jgi:hypothetical protein